MREPKIEFQPVYLRWYLISSFSSEILNVADFSEACCRVASRARCPFTTSPVACHFSSRARALFLTSPFTLFLSLPIHCSALPRSLSLSPVRHGRAAELLRRSLLHCLDIIEPPSTASASASGASTASPTLAMPPFAVSLCRHNSRRRGMPPTHMAGRPRTASRRARQP